MSYSDFEINLYEIVYNNGLGKSHLLKKKVDKNGYDVFLFYCEGHRCHFVICDAVLGTKEGCSFCRTQYYYELTEAVKAFKKC